MKIRFGKVKLEETPNWNKGQQSKCSPKGTKKQICVVTFYDEYGNVYNWCPLKGETNEVISVARQMILAEELNFPHLKNPESRPDIDELRDLVKLLEDKV